MQNNKYIIIDGHHRARAAGSVHIEAVPVEIIDISNSEQNQYLDQALEAAEQLGIPWN